MVVPIAVTSLPLLCRATNLSRWDLTQGCYRCACPRCSQGSQEHPKAGLSLLAPTSGPRQEGQDFWGGQGASLGTLWGESVRGAGIGGRPLHPAVPFSDAVIWPFPGEAKCERHRALSDYAGCCPDGPPGPDSRPPSPGCVLGKPGPHCPSVPLSTLPSTHPP